MKRVMTSGLLTGVMATVALLATGPMAWSAATSTWPCVQRKVAEISLAAIWPGPELDAVATTWRDDAAVAELVQRLAVRRTSLADATAAIAEFARASGNGRARQLQMVMAGLLETINAERAEVMAGLERFGDGQKQMAELLRMENAKVSELRTAANPNPADVDARAEQLLWNLRIFNERQKSLSAVCEVPVLIEQRLFALAKEIHKALQER